MPPLTQRKHLTNEEKLNIIEDSKNLDFVERRHRSHFQSLGGTSETIAVFY